MDLVSLIASDRKECRFLSKKIILRQHQHNRVAAPNVTSQRFPQRRHSTFAFNRPDWQLGYVQESHELTLSNRSVEWILELVSAKRSIYIYYLSRLNSGVEKVLSEISRSCRLKRSPFGHKRPAARQSAAKFAERSGVLM